MSQSHTFDSEKTDSTIGPRIRRFLGPLQYLRMRQKRVLDLTQLVAASFPNMSMVASVIQKESEEDTMLGQVKRTIVNSFFVR